MAVNDTLVDLLRENTKVIPGGENLMWMNGMHIPSTKIEAFSLLSLMRRERGFMTSLRNLGLTNPEAVNLLSHERIAEKIEMGTTNRFDIRDDVEGGGVIIWLNDLEKDSRYKPWPNDIQHVLHTIIDRALTIGNASFVSGTITYHSQKHSSRGVCLRLVKKGGSKSSRGGNGHIGETNDSHTIRYCGVIR